MTWYCPTQSELWTLSQLWTKKSTQIILQYPHLSQSNYPTIRNKISEIYEEIIKWRKNLFLVPPGKSGTDFIKELTRLLQLFVDETKWMRLALARVHIFIPLMLQKPSAKSKARDHTKYLEKRLKWWNLGGLDSVLSENPEIQKN